MSTSTQIRKPQSTPAAGLQANPPRAMLRRALVVVSDLAALAGGGLVVAALGGDLAPSPSTWLVYAVAAWAWMVGHRLYSSRFVRERREELGRLTRANVLALVTLAGFAAVADEPVDLRGAVALLVATGGLLALEREVLRGWFRTRRRSGHALWASILVANAADADDLRASIDGDRSSPHVVRGEVDPATTTGPNDLLTAVVALARQEGAHGVIVAESALDRRSANTLVRGLLDAGLYVDVSSSLADLSTDRLATHSLGSSVATWIAPRPRTGWRAGAKRLFDVVVTGSALLVLSPVMIAVALAVKLSSPGPVLFRQERVGRSDKPFHMLKFRSMVVDAEKRLAELSEANEGAGPLFKMKDDPRVTRVGRFIRKTSLDELPQLFNVLRNEMSLVGPRPALRSEMAQWSPDLYARLEVKPGITGMWQVSGRSGTSFDEYTRLDLYYVHNWSLLVDVSILVRTLPAVVKSDGAF
jgi:exopolysaccharide biosynthesis polyprenyl glycosylphosphotransferase